MKHNIYNILRGNFLTNETALKHWRFIVFLSLLGLIMITSSHNADKKVHKIAELNEEIKALRSEMIEGRRTVMSLKSETIITNKVTKLNIKPSIIPPKKIKITSY